MTKKIETIGVEEARTRHPGAELAVGDHTVRGHTGPTIFVDDAPTYWLDCEADEATLADRGAVYARPIPAAEKVRDAIRDYQEMTLAWLRGDDDEVGEDALVFAFDCVVGYVRDRTGVDISDPQDAIPSYFASGGQADPYDVAKAIAGWFDDQEKDGAA